MQPHAPRPSLQPTQRPPAGFSRGGVQVPSRDHFSATPYAAPQTYASATQAMFAVESELQTPYEQEYHFSSAQNHREFRFPFRAFMVALVVSAISFSLFAAYNAVTYPSPVNADQREIEP